MHRTPEKSAKERSWHWFGTPLRDSGRCPMDGGINRSNHATQIADNQFYETDGLEYKRGSDTPSKEPGYARLSKQILGTELGAISDFKDSSGTNHLVIYNDGFLYEVNETTGALTQINSAQLVSQADPGASLIKHGDSLIIAFSGQLYEWTGSGQPTVLSNSPSGADWVVQHKDRLWCNSSTEGVIRGSDPGYSLRNTWDSDLAINVGRTGEPLRSAISHADFLLIFQDNNLSALNIKGVVEASTLDTWSNVLGAPGRYSAVKCGDFGTAYYTTEGIKFIDIHGLRPITISNKIQDDLEAIPAGMRSKVALGWHDGRLRVSFADDGNTGVNNKEFVCHIEDALVSGKGVTDAVWVGPNSKYISLYYTRLSNSGVKNELTWGDSRNGLLYVRSDGTYTFEDSTGATSNATCSGKTKFAQLADLGKEAWVKKVYFEADGNGAITLTGYVNKNTGATVATLSDTGADGFPYTFPITFAQEVDFRDSNTFWPALTDVSTITAKGEYIALGFAETSTKSFRLIKMGILADNDGRIR